jgi:alpha-L-fucosidase
MVDDTIGAQSWGYIEGLRIASAESIVGKLIDTASKGGLYMLNISPMADGTIPQNQQDVLVKIGEWLATNGEAIYDTRPWSQFREGAWHFTSKGQAVYAIATAWPGGEAVISALGYGAGKVSRVELLGHAGALTFSQDEQGLKVTLPAEHSAGLAWVLRIARQ